MSDPPAWKPGDRYSYAQWSRLECRMEAKVRVRERARIARLTDQELWAWLYVQADVVDISWTARVCYRACRFEAVTVRAFTQEIPRL